MPARFASARACSSRYVDQSRQSLNDAQVPSGRKSPSGLDMIKRRHLRDAITRLRRTLQLPRRRSSSSRSASSRAANATACIWPRCSSTGGNVLLLDEPTNDLDVETLRALEEALLAFPGCAVVISHDRWFLDRIATHILAFEGNCEVVWFEGNYAEYVQDFHRRRGTDADQPHRDPLQAPQHLNCGVRIASATPVKTPSSTRWNAAKRG